MFIQQDSVITTESVNHPRICRSFGSLYPEVKAAHASRFLIDLNGLATRAVCFVLHSLSEQARAASVQGSSSPAAEAVRLLALRHAAEGLTQHDRQHLPRIVHRSSITPQEEDILGVRSGVSRRTRIVLRATGGHPPLESEESGRVRRPLHLHHER